MAAGVVPIAHANDGGGSIRIPAAVNGLVGLKPTRDRLAAGQADAASMPVRIVADGVVTRACATPRRSCARPRRSTAPLHLPPIGDLTRPAEAGCGSRVQTERRWAGRASPGGHRAHPQDGRRCSSRSATTSRRSTRPIAGVRFPDDFLLYWSTLALFLVRNGRRLHGRVLGPGRLDNLTRGLAGTRAATCTGCPVRSRRLRGATASRRSFYTTYDVAPHAHAGAPRPRVIGHLDPTAGLRRVIERLLDWVAFTPLQNVTGEPAISLPLATTAAGLPQGMMFGAGAGREATLIELAYELEEAAPFASIRAEIGVRAGPGPISARRTPVYRSPSLPL